MPSARYSIWLAMPSREPSAAAPTSTTIGWNVNGTGVNGSGTLTCAATAVSTVTNTHGASLFGGAKRARIGARAVIVASKVGCMSGGS